VAPLNAEELAAPAQAGPRTLCALLQWAMAAQRQFAYAAQGAAGAAAGAAGAAGWGAEQDEAARELRALSAEVVGAMEAVSFSEVGT
jgi:hypothetical protein